MQPFALTVEGDHDTISDELVGALANVFPAETADEATADVAHALAGTATELVGSKALGDGVDRYVVSINGAAQAGNGHDGLDSVTLSVSAVTRTITDTPGGGEPAAQV